MKSEAPVEVVKVALDVEEAEVMVEVKDVEVEVYHNIRYTEYTEYTAVRISKPGNLSR